MGIVVSYMVLASQFNSFIHPVTVLMALPFSFSGAFLGLYICNQSINIYSLIGFILLMGIVKSAPFQMRTKEIDEEVASATPIVKEAK